MRRLKAFALCVAMILALSGAAYAQHGIEAKASVLFGAKLNLADVGNIGAEGTATMEWVENAEGGLELKTTGIPGDDRVKVSPEATGYPIFLEVGYTMDKFSIGGFWTGQFKAKGEAKGEVEGFDKANYYGFEQFIFQPAAGKELALDAMVFFGGKDMPVLPGIAYYWGHYSKVPEEDGKELYILEDTDIVSMRYRAPHSHGGIGRVEWDVDPAKGATKWTSDVSFNLDNYGLDAGYNVFDQNNIKVTALVGLEKLGWSEEIKNSAKEVYDINFTTMDIEYGVDSSVDNYGMLVAQLYGDIFGNDTDVAAMNEENGYLYPDHDAFVREYLGPGDDVTVTGATLEKFFLHQASKLEAVRDIEVVRRLNYDPFGYSIGASVGTLVADKVRVNANLSLGWFSGDAKVKIITKDNRTATFEPVAREGMGTWKYTIEAAEAEELRVDIPIPDDSEVWVPTAVYEAVAEGMDDLSTESIVEKTHVGTKATMLKAQVSATYDVTEAIFVGGGLFYSQWKDMPVLSDTNALGITTQDISASGINVEVGIRF